MEQVKCEKCGALWAAEAGQRVSLVEPGTYAHCDATGGMKIVALPVEALADVAGGFAGIGAWSW